jgi:drug/metabolite transporter (DMT)-like permease
MWVSSSASNLVRGRGRALAEMAGAAGLWGTSFPVIQYGISGGLDPVLFGALRFMVAAPIMLVLAASLRRALLPFLKLKVVWALAFLNTVGFVAQFLGQASTPAPVAALLVNLWIFAAAAGSAALLGERFGVSKALGTALAGFGTVLLTTGGDPLRLGGSQAVGDILCLVSAASWGAYIVLDKKETDRLGWDPLALTAMVVTLSAVMFAPAAAFIVGRGATLSAASWEVVIYTAVVNTAIPYALYQSALRFLSATVSAVVLVIEILTAVVISSIFLGESLGAVSFLGAGMVLASIYLVSAMGSTGTSLSTTVPRQTGMEGTA